MTVKEIKRKIKKLSKKTINIINSEKSKYKTVVTANGCFDLIHGGHLYFLGVASQEGDMLVVGLNSDKSVRALKGPERPILNEYQRAFAIASLPFVNYVLLYDEPTSEEFVRLVRPDIHCNFSTYGANCVERPILDSYGGKLKLIRPVSGMPSTTSIIEKLNT